MNCKQFCEFYQLAVITGCGRNADTKEKPRAEERRGFRLSVGVYIAFLLTKNTEPLNQVNPFVCMFRIGTSSPV